MRAVLRAAGCDPSRDLGVDVTMRRTLDRGGRVAGEFACPQTLDLLGPRVPHAAASNFRTRRYHVGKELQRVEQAGDRVVAHFADGTAAEGELLVGADGFRSNVRAEVLPEVKPVYAGYIAWRGLVDESALPPAVHADIFDAMVFGLPPNEQFISYPVAGPRQRPAARPPPLQFRLVSPGRRSDRAAAPAHRRERAISTRSAFRRRWCGRR